jgi:hypothetical protein
MLLIEHEHLSRSHLWSGQIILPRARRLVSSVLAFARRVGRFLRLGRTRRLLLGRRRRRVIPRRRLRPRWRLRPRRRRFTNRLRLLFPALLRLARPRIFRRLRLWLRDLRTLRLARSDRLAAAACVRSRTVITRLGRVLTHGTNRRRAFAAASVCARGLRVGARRSRDCSRAFRLAVVEITPSRLDRIAPVIETRLA